MFLDFTTTSGHGHDHEEVSKKEEIIGELNGFGD